MFSHQPLDHRFDERQSFNPNTYTHTHEASTSEYGNSGDPTKKRMKIVLRKKKLDDIDIVHVKNSPIKGRPASCDPVSHTVTTNENATRPSALNTSSRYSTHKGTDYTRRSAFQRENSRDSFIFGPKRGRENPLVTEHHSAVKPSARGSTVGSRPDISILHELDQFNEKLPENRQLVKKRATPLTGNPKQLLDELLIINNKLPIETRMETRNSLSSNDVSFRMTRMTNHNSIPSAMRYSTYGGTNRPPRSGMPQSHVKEVKFSNYATPNRSRQSTFDMLPSEETHIYNPNLTQTSHAESHVRTVSQGPTSSVSGSNRYLESSFDDSSPMHNPYDFRLKLTRVENQPRLRNSIFSPAPSIHKNLSNLFKSNYYPAPDL